MRIRLTAGLTSVLALMLPALAFSEPLHAVKDRQLVQILNNFKTLGKSETDLLVIRLVRVHDLGECDGRLATCPQEVVYIAVSNLDLAADQAVYILPKAYGWELVRWKRVPRVQADGESAILEMRRKVIDNSGNLEKWAYKNYDVRVSPFSGEIVERK